MAPTRNNELKQRCNNCTLFHTGKCTNQKYLNNLSFKCECKKEEIQIRGNGSRRFKNHCCYCKLESKFDYCKWTN